MYINTLGEVSNLWLQPLDGGKAVQITDFKSDLILNSPTRAMAANSRSLAGTRGATRH